MAFTAAQKTLAHELLGLFEGSVYDWREYVDGITGETSSVPFGQTIDFTEATTLVAGRFTAIEAGSDNREARIGEILARYSDISLDTARLGPGGADSAPGVRWDPDNERDHLRGLLQAHLGFELRLLRRGPGGPTGSGRSIRASR